MTIILIVAMFVVLLKTKLPADIVFLCVVSLLLLTGCISAKDALSGFSSETVVVVGVLFIVVSGMEATGVLHWVVKHLLGQPSTYKRAIVRLMLPVAALSAFLSNTTVVAMSINVVKMWAKKLKMAPSKFLIPLSYAAGMGGVCTLIGTPPNLIISEFYVGATGHKLGVFSTTIVGLFCLAIGVLSILLLRKLLPSRQTPQDILDASNQVTTELKVPAGSHLVGQSVSEITLLKQCDNCKLIGLVHFDGEVEQISEDADNSTVFLMGGDTLIFTGDKQSVIATGKKIGIAPVGLDSYTDVQIGAKTLLSSIIMIAMVLLSAFNVIPLLNSCIIAAILMLVSRCCSIKQAKQAINWDVLMVFASSVVIGKALDSTGLASMLANGLASVCHSNALVAFILICFLGTFLTEFVSNTACGAILAPVAIGLATNLGVNPLTFCIGLMVSVSSSFATPIGSPTHLLVYVPGGYRFSDFLRIGLPMNFIILAANIFITLLLFPL